MTTDEEAKSKESLCEKDSRFAPGEARRRQESQAQTGQGRRCPGHWREAHFQPRHDLRERRGARPALLPRFYGVQTHRRLPYEGTPVYARLRAPGGDGTIALHLAGPGVSIASEGVRLYFEVRDLDGFCQKLQQKGFYITQMPRLMPWGWRHAYLNDPDGHEISLDWAGENRMQKTVMQAARKAAQT